MSMLLRRRYANTDAQTENKGVTTTKAVAPSPSNKEFTEEKINSMNGTQLRKLATKNGIDNPEELTVGELKAVLCDVLVK